MCRVRRFAGALLFVAFVPLAVGGCTFVDPLILGAWAIQQGLMTPAEREEYWRQWREKKARQVEKERERKIKEAVAAAREAAEPAGQLPLMK